MNKLDGASLNIEQMEMEKLRAVFPQCFADGKLDIDKLLSLCGEYIDNDFEKYKFEWKGKSEALRLAQQRSMGTLRPAVEDSVDWDTTENLYIEGDNLEVLKLLQTAYYRKVKMIYIDPPYNTGNDFVYEDDFKDPISKYKEITGQTTKSNPESMGRFHTNWLNMIYPRLRLASNLLSDDGVIFISIDDNEVHNLRKVCDEVFGEENFVAQIIWQKVYSPRMDVQGFSTSHDYILCYVKSDINSIQREVFEQNAKQFNFFDEVKKLQYRRRSIRKEGSNSLRTDAPNSYFPLVSPDGTEIYPIKPDGTEGCWRWSITTYNENLDQDNVEWVLTENGWQVYAKQYLDVNATKPPETLWFHSEVNHNHGAAEEVKKLLDAKIFDSPKPKELLFKILGIATRVNENDIILDFFSGSGTTAHAVMQLNAEDGGNRKFICVQLPEVTDEKSEAYKAGYKNICEIGKERIRRAGKVISSKLLVVSSEPESNLFDNQPTTNNQQPTTQKPDTGFRVFKLDSSNLKTWDATPTEDVDLFVQRMND
ncbi:MAG: site-specific DNA-methyltransferase, partial [Rikenellaceae bacterium]